MDYSNAAEQQWLQVSWRWLQQQPWLVRTILLLTIYIGLGLLLEAFADQYRSALNIQPWDPASGLHIVLLFGFGFRYAPAIFFVPFLEDVVWQGEAQTYYLFEALSALCICLGYSGAAYFLLRSQKIDPCLRSLKDMLWFAAVFLGTALLISGISLLSQTAIAAPVGSDWFQKWMHDWAGEANGIMMVAPPCLLFLRIFPWSQQQLTLQEEPPALNLTGWLRQDPTGRVALVGGTVLFAWLAYGGLRGNATEFSYVVFIPVIWTAISYGFERTTVCLLILNVSAVIFAENGGESGNDVLAIQFGLLTVTTVGALLGAYVTDYQMEIDRRQQLEKELKYQATHDGLTGLYSRFFFRQQLAKVVEKPSNRSADELVLFFIDVDRFKDVNDSLGHLVGDRLLASIASRIEHCLSKQLDPETFFACRFSGDEFVVLITPPLPPGGISNRASGQVRFERTNQQTVDRKAIEVLAGFLCDCLAEVYEIDGYRLPTTVSMGVAFSDPIYEGADNLLRNADIALYEAKAAGRGRYMVFNQRMYEALVERSQLERDLSQAVLQIDNESIVANG
ncbi:sensor domain-containing diguanylate cyclase [cf. Phormidesmis sp. LEGE 11477]|nr:sensor domain-containing diguanylate cyclase [cf. Phormidesmis sp. LEGE 11477]